MRTKESLGSGTAPIKWDTRKHSCCGKLETGVFCYGQKAYSVETKLACIEMKKAGKSNKVIMDTLSIKNASQAKTW